MNSHCCHGKVECESDSSRLQETGRGGLQTSSPLRRLLGAVQWAAPGVVLVLMPKCPVCVAAYVALFTGMGISLSTATHLRTLVLMLCFVTLASLAARSAAGRKVGSRL